MWPPRPQQVEAVPFSARSRRWSSSQWSLSSLMLVRARPRGNTLIGLSVEGCTAPLVSRRTFSLETSVPRKTRRHASCWVVVLLGACSSSGPLDSGTAEVPPDASSVLDGGQLDSGTVVDSGSRGDGGSDGGSQARDGGTDGGRPDAGLDGGSRAPCSGSERTVRLSRGDICFSWTDVTQLVLAPFQGVRGFQ